MSEPVDTCLQCGQTRTEVVVEQTSCCTVSIGEYVEVDRQWDRHHWRDWSDTELTAARVHPSLWEANRRTLESTLWWVAIDSICITRGRHEFLGPDEHDPEWDMPIDICQTCFAKQGESDL